MRKPPIKKQIASDQDTVLKLLGSQFKDKRRLEEYLGAAVHVRNSTITIEERSRSKLERAEKLLTDLLSRAMFGDPPFFQGPFDRGGSGRQYITAGNRRNIFLKTKGQERFYDAVQKHDLVFVIGPAGTGKTYCAVAMAVQCLRQRLVDRIILVRPAVEAGESLGFLPGNLRDKVEPYLAPLYDALYDILPRDTIAQHFEEKTIEVSPLAYMRGRTLNNAFIILDEAQNTTLAQMKMFLTRMGVGSKAVVAGDVTQIDLASKKQSGLQAMEGVLAGIEGISFVALDAGDVVRHRLVKDIIAAYGKFEGANGQ